MEERIIKEDIGGVEFAVLSYDGDEIIEKGLYTEKFTGSKSLIK